MKKILAAALVASGLALSGAAFASINADNTGTKSTSAKTVNLFIQSARKGEIDDVKGQPGTYTLKLMDVSNYVEFFSDRPVRKTGLMFTSEFIKQWDEGNSESFAANPPNAGIAAVEAGIIHRKPIRFTAELSHPVYDAKNHTMTYTLHALKGFDKMPVQTDFDDLAIFIDNFCASCSSGGF